MFPSDERNIIVATKNFVVIDVYDIGHFLPTTDEMLNLEYLARQKGIRLQLVEVNDNIETNYGMIANALAHIEMAVAESPRDLSRVA